MVKSSNRRAPLLAAAPGGAGPAGEAWGDAPAGGGAPPPAELDLALALALVVVTAALVAGADEEAELDDDDDAMPAWMDGDADTAAESMVTATTTL